MALFSILLIFLITFYRTQSYLVRFQRQKNTGPLWLSSFNEDLSSNEEELRRERMQQVRSVQESFYASPSDIRSRIEGDMVRNLPLYRRVGQTELPGRSTLLYVADPRHTHMVETIVRGGPEPWLLGQLYLADGKFDDFGSVEGWRNKTVLPQDGETPQDGSEIVIGTLLRIVDVRRITDGRMVLLVQGIERFVVERPIQDRPYPVVDARIVPDAEDLEWAVANGYSRLQGRLTSLQEALLECESNIKLPGDLQQEISVADLVGVDLERFMPLAPFQSAALRPPVTENELVEHSNDGEAVSVELELIHYRLLQDFPSLKQGSVPSAQSLEQLLWTRIEDYVCVRNVKYSRLPRELLRLYPCDTEWPETRNLRQYIVENKFFTPPTMGQISEHQEHRRQRRLSHAATVLLGGTARSTGLLNRGMRQKLLEIPSTAGRLWAVIECFDEFLQRAE